MSSIEKTEMTTPCLEIAKSCLIPSCTKRTESDIDRFESYIKMQVYIRCTVCRDLCVQLAVNSAKVHADTALHSI